MSTDAETAVTAAPVHDMEKDASATNGDSHMTNTNGNASKPMPVEKEPSEDDDDDVVVDEEEVEEGAQEEDALFTELEHVEEEKEAKEPHDQPTDVAVAPTLLKVALAKGEVKSDSEDEEAKAADEKKKEDAAAAHHAHHRVSRGRYRVVRRVLSSSGGAVGTKFGAFSVIVLGGTPYPALVFFSLTLFLACSIVFFFRRINSIICSTRPVSTRTLLVKIWKNSKRQ